MSVFIVIIGWYGGVIAAMLTTPRKPISNKADRYPRQHHKKS